MKRKINFDTNPNQTFSLPKHPSIGYKTGSLPRYSQPQVSNNLRLSSDNKNSDIYFDKLKKSRFMKNIVDGYFDEKIDNDDGVDQRQVNSIISNIRNVVKKGKYGFYGSNRGSPTNFSDQLSEKPVIFQKAVRERPVNRQIRNQISLFEDDTRNSDSLYISSSVNINSNTFLPPIQELNEEPLKGYQVQGYSNINDQVCKFPELSQSTIEQKQLKDEKQQIQIYENQAFKIFLVHENQRPAYRIKEFKASGMEIMRRQQKINQLGIESLWKQSQISANCFLSSLIPPLKNLICKIIPNLQNSSVKSNSTSQLCKFKIKSSSFRRYLLANDCLELKHMIREICLVLKRLQGKVLNNKINPSNIFITKGKVTIGEWGYSSFRDQYQIQKNQFQSRTHPILKSQNQWFTTPQYLSPEILMAVSAKNQEEQPDIWENGCASDIWSLGITIFEIITMLPIWMNDPCVIRYTSSKRQSKTPTNLSCPQRFTPNQGQPKAVVMKPRKGFLASDDRKIQKIIEKQKSLNKLIRKSLNTQIEQEIDSAILEMITKMILFDPSQRIGIDEILHLLK